MRILFDANVFISYLLPTENTEKAEKIHYIIDAGFEGRYMHVFPQELLSEIRKKIKGKPYLAKHITQEDAEEFIAILSTVAELISPLTEQIPQFSRDKKDDYLVAYAAVGECDYLVTGDEDLLIIKQVGKLKIVNPAEFYEILKKIR